MYITTSSFVLLSSHGTTIKTRQKKSEYIRKGMECGVDDILASTILGLRSKLNRVTPLGEGGDRPLVPS